jgi:xylulokinase
MKIIAYDLGTGGVKASLYDGELGTLAKVFIEYETYYPTPEKHMQKPEDWWNAVCVATKKLLDDSQARPEEITCTALSGHSLVAVPMDEKGHALLELVPIWSDTTGAGCAEEFFSRVPEEEWYLKTGNGFPSACYPIFKLMLLAKTEPELIKKTKRVLGSKDYINFRLTGEMATDPSYASGSGGYDLKSGRFIEKFFDAAGLSLKLFPEIVPSHTVIGSVTREAAAECGLAAGTPVACGGVDNACMAHGAVGAGDGNVYLSLGSSSWIAVNSPSPVLDFVKKPYVFAHIAENLFTSAFSIFSAGSSLKWVRDNVFSGDGGFQELDMIADKVAPGSGGIYFNPSLAGGSSQDKSPNIRGAYIGLHLGTTRAELLRAAMEGITLGLKTSYDFVKKHADLEDSLLICGGGSKSKVWLQMFADVFDIEIIKTNIDQDAASLGAAAIAARAAGLWLDYSGIEGLHRVETRCKPRPEYAAVYKNMLQKYIRVAESLSDLGDILKT